MTSPRTLRAARPAVWMSEVAEPEARFESPAELEAAVKRLEAEMKEAAKRLDFERAAELRDRVKALRRVDLDAR